MSEKEETQKIQEEAKRKAEEEAAKEPEKKSALEEAREVRDQLKSENDRREEIMKREEEMYAKNILSGKTDAGDAKLTPEQLKKAEAQRLADEITNAFK